jgi:hypothetical protein
MASPKQRAIWREQNEERREYFRKYYSGERYEKHKENMRIRMRKDDLFAEPNNKTNHEKKLESRYRGSKIKVNGIILYHHNYVKRYLINNIKPRLFEEYTAKGIIPEPIFVRVGAGGRKRRYYSAKQVKLINKYFFTGEKSKRLSVEKISEALHKKWNVDTINFGIDFESGGEDAE